MQVPKRCFPVLRILDVGHSPQTCNSVLYTIVRTLQILLAQYNVTLYQQYKPS
jgi:hypothetical protein